MIALRDSVNCKGYVNLIINYDYDYCKSSNCKTVAPIERASSQSQSIVREREVAVRKNSFSSFMFHLLVLSSLPEKHSDASCSLMTVQCASRGNNPQTDDRN
jgi:hypothetical protein